MSTVAAWFTALCPPDRRPLNAPLLVRFGGSLWRVACDGTALTMLRGGSTVPQTTEAREMAARIPSIVRIGRRKRQRIEWSQLELFLAGARARNDAPATGLVAPGIVVDRCLLKRFLGPLTAPTVDIYFGGELDQVHFVTRDWRVTIMPMRLANSGPQLIDTRACVPIEHRALRSGTLATPNRKPAVSP